jgi:hypothetical protein
MMNSDLKLLVGNYARFTTDGGITWDSTEISNEGFNIIHFYTGERGIAISGSHGWTTTDGGRTWNRKGEVGIEKDIYFYNEKLGWMVGEGPGNDAGHVAKTTGGGSTWEFATVYFTPLNGITFIDSLKGFAVGASAGGGYYITKDGGENWQSPPILKMYGYDLGFINDKDGWITQWGQIIRTSDGGDTWTKQLIDYAGYQFIKLMILKKDKVAYVLGVNPNDNTATLLRADLSNITDVKEKKEVITDKYYLAQNYPNPFNPSTIISYDLSATGHVLLKVYDILGREVATLVDKIQPVGRYKVEFNGSNLSSGIYFYSLTAGDFNQTKKLILMK